MLNQPVFHSLRNREYCYGRTSDIVELLKSQNTYLDKTTYIILPESDHVFYGKEDILVKTVADWL